MKRKTTSVILSFYIFIVLGFVLHTSTKPQVLEKYTHFYFFLLLILLLACYPLRLLLLWLQKDSYLQFQKKLILLSIKTKCILLISFLLASLLVIEVSIRMHPGKMELNGLTIADYDPYLQNKLSVSRNIHVDADGFRGEEVKKDKKTFRIFALGGSTVLSSLVPYEKSSMRVLEKLLQKKYPEKSIQILNAADNGYTTKHAIIEYMFKLKNYHPNMIIMWHGINDLNQSCTASYYTNGAYEPDYSHYFGTTFHMVNTNFNQKPIISINLRIVSIFFDAIRYNFYSDIFERFHFPKRHFSYRGVPVSDFPSITSYRRNLQTFIDILHSDDVSLILGNQASLFKKNMNPDEIDTLAGIALPCERDGTYPDVASLMRGLSQFNKATYDIAEINNVPFVNLESKVPKSLNYFADDVHTTEKGDQIIAKSIYEYVISHNML